MISSKLGRIACYVLLGATLVHCSADSTSDVKSNWKETAYPEVPDLNDPKFLMPNANRQFDALPLVSRFEANSVPWSESYYANMFGGVARRWASPADDPWTYLPPSKEQLLKMDRAAIRKLSAVEKLDIYLGRYNYPLLKLERDRVKKEDPAWAGLCNGWTAVSLALKEPRAVYIRNSDGIEIPFAASDIKALYMLNQDWAVTRQHNKPAFIGGSCPVSKFDAGDIYTRDERCTDVNAGAFHLALANMIGLEKKGLIADLERDVQIWNHPIYGYSTVVKSRHSIATGSRITVHTTINYVTESGTNFYPVIGTPNQREKTQLYSYTIELNASGKIVGGDWISEERPDFVWFEPLSALEPEFTGLDQIYQQSLKTGIVKP